MTQYSAINKIIKKGKKIESPLNLEDYILKYLSSFYNESLSREVYFISLYYGLIGDALTLESIGQKQEHPLTRERVRQIIDGTLKKASLFEINFESPFSKAKKEFTSVIGKQSFIRLSDLVKNSFFKSFKSNPKGLISFLNDCDIKQIAYRKNYYFYQSNLDRNSVIHDIQSQNKTLRREQTVANMSKKSKTVTYVPNIVREYLLSYSNLKKINLNPLYEIIIEEFIKEAPFNSSEFKFSKTKSWKARKGTAQWQQIGIYIDKSVFEKIKTQVDTLKTEQKKSVSLMSFICEAFIWHQKKYSK